MKKRLLTALFALTASAALSIGLAACGGSSGGGNSNGGNNDGEHTHTYSSDWTSDENGHWHAATCEHTTEKGDYAAHTYANKTYSEYNATISVCSVCSYGYSENLPYFATTNTFKTKLDESALLATSYVYKMTGTEDDNGSSKSVATLIEYDGSSFHYYIGDSDGYVDTYSGTCGSHSSVYYGNYSVLTIDDCSNLAIFSDLDDIKNSFASFSYSQSTQSYYASSVATPYGTYKTVTLKFEDGELVYASYYTSETGVGTYNYEIEFGAASVSYPLSSYDFTFDYGDTYFNDNATITVTGVNEGVETLVIPESVTIGGKSYAITAIEDLSSTTLKSLTIPSTITSLSTGTFAGCSALESITLPFLGTSATNAATLADMYGGYSVPATLKSVTVTGGELCDDAFAGLTQLQSVTLSGVTAIGDGAFEGCTALTNITIPNSVTAIGSYAFSGCTATVSFASDMEITSIGSYMFAGYAGASFEIPTSVAYIEEHAFDGCTASVTFASGTTITSIDSYAFAGFAGESLEIPASVTSVGAYAFSGCTATVSFASGMEITSIDSYMFAGYAGTSIEIPASVTYIDEYSFDGCMAAVSFASGTAITTIGSNAFADYAGTSIEIPDTVTSITEGAFTGCSNLVSITLPFAGGRANATSASSSTLFGYIFGSTQYEGGTSTWQGYAASYGVTYYIPTTLTTVTITGGNIYYGVFYGCNNLTNITIPDGVTSISDYAFCGCSSLASVNVPDGVTSIGNYAFTGCSSLTSITIPDGVTSIGNYAFNICSSLTSIDIPDGVPSIGSYAFNGCSSLTSVTV